MSQPQMDFREGSRRNWVSKGASLTNEKLQSGALLRIADACEKMCLDREKMERDYKYMRKSQPAIEIEVACRRMFLSHRNAVTFFKKLFPVELFILSWKHRDRDIGVSIEKGGPCRRSTTPGLEDQIDTRRGCLKLPLQ